MTDGGAGALTALGLRLLDAHGQALEPGGAALQDITAIDDTDLDHRLPKLSLRLASDVTNPLLGTTGAAYVFAPQKGASSTDTVGRLDNALDRWCRVLALHHHVEPERPAAGAAGGLAFGLSTLIPQATLEPGFDLVANLIRLDNALDATDVVMTGEGSLDHQSLSGKGPIGVIDRALRRNLPTYVLAGRITVKEDLRTRGVTGCFALQDSAHSLEDSIRRAPALLRAAAAAATDRHLAASDQPNIRRRQPT
jgi:glycerate kinase